VYAKYKDKGFVIIGIANDKLDSLKKYVEQEQITWPQIIQEEDKTILKKYNIYGYPTTYLIDPQGKIKEKNILPFCFKNNYINYMNTIADIKKILSNHKHLLSEKYPIKNIAVFGSYSRNEQNQKSDIDILVEFNAPIGIEFVDLAEELEKILHSRVDLISKNGVKKSYLDYIEKDLIYV
jgi:predicted nucleotidyltransferase